MYDDEGFGVGEKRIYLARKVGASVFNLGPSCTVQAQLHDF
jgi:hypothetical protein